MNGPVKPIIVVVRNVKKPNAKAILDCLKIARSVMTTMITYIVLNGFIEGYKQDKKNKAQREQFEQGETEQKED